MMLNSLVLSICLLNLFLIANSISGGVKDIRRWQQATTEVKSVKQIAEKTCSLSFDFTFDIETFVKGTELSELDNKEINHFCGAMFAAFADLCVDAGYRNTLASTTSTSCAFDKNITVPSAKLEAGHLQLTFNWDTTNHRETVRDYLKQLHSRS